MLIFSSRFILDMAISDISNCFRLLESYPLPILLNLLPKFGNHSTSLDALVAKGKKYKCIAMIENERSQTKLECMTK